MTDFYTTEELLDRLYKQIDTNKKSALKHKIVLPFKPAIETYFKKTKFANFTEMAKSINRSPEDLASFYISELSTVCNITADGSLLISGKFSEVGIQNILFITTCI